jgi:tRNA(Ile)-lysidine synthase
VSSEPVVVMYSGGRDSTCLLHICVTEAGADAVTALHVNYGLRGAAADEDERACAALCDRLGVALCVHRAGPPPASGNLQAWARSVRYAEATRLAVERDAVIAVGHTADDQAETVLYRLLSSPSRRAVLGMQAADGRIVRPLLSMTRAETTAYCEGHGLSWRDDASNDSDAYVRNRIRNELLPLLRELHPGASRNLLALAERLRLEGEVLDELVDAALAPGGTIDLARLRALPPALARLVVQRLADDALGPGGVAAGASRFAEAVAALSDRGTAQLDLGHGLRAISEYGVLRVDSGNFRGLYQPSSSQSGRLSVPGTVAFGGGRVVCEAVAPARESGVLDRDAVGDSLVVRAWRAGDRMRPLGLGGSKSLQDLFTARKVPRARRAGVAVVEAHGEIAWVEGVATAERFKVRDATTRAVRLSVDRP